MTIVERTIDGCKCFCESGAVQQTASSGLRQGLEIGLIVLVILLVGIGLWLGFRRIKDDREDEYNWEVK